MQVLQPPASQAEAASRSKIVEKGRYEALQSAFLDSWAMWTLILELVNSIWFVDLLPSFKIRSTV